MWKSTLSDKAQEYGQKFWYCECVDIEKIGCKMCFASIHGQSITNATRIIFWFNQTMEKYEKRMIDISIKTQVLSL